MKNNISLKKAKHKIMSIIKNVFIYLIQIIEIYYLFYHTFVVEFDIT